MARYDVVIDSVIGKVIRGDIEARWVIAVSKCIDVDRIMALECPFCGMRFKRRGVLARHISYKHVHNYVEIIECAVSLLKTWRVKKGGRSG